MQTIKWGPGLWTSLHCMTFNYPTTPDDTDKINYKSFFTLLGDMLPCVYCRQSYKIYLECLPINDFLDSREGISYWLFTLHNFVNKKIGKPLISFNECVEIYEKMRAKCGKVIENSVEFETCRKNSSIINPSIIDTFVSKSKKYDEFVENGKNKLNNHPKNPNKEACICRYKIYHDKY
jgi:hypothetical protein